MRIRYAYKLENAEGATSFVVLNHIKSEEEVLNSLADKGIVKVTFHDRVRTGFRLNEQGELVPTGLGKAAAQDAPVAVDAAPEAPKAKKAKSTKKSK